MEKTAINLIFLSIVVFIFSCGNTTENQNKENSKQKIAEKEQVKEEQKGDLQEDEQGTFTDSRDGKIYKTVKIGNQIWMAENLAYKPNSTEATLCNHEMVSTELGNFWIYDDKEENIKKYGYLYDYKATLKAVPKGWHLPTKEEFQALLKHYGEKPYNALADKQGFTLVFSGWYFSESSYVQEGEGVGFWSSNINKEDKEQALVCAMDKIETNIYANISPRYMVGTGAAVRLIKGDLVQDNSLQNATRVYEKFDDDSPKTSKGNFSDFIAEYNEIIKGEGYTVENPDVDRMFTEVTIKKKDGKLRMVEISESDRHYDNSWQYFYKNNEVFYVLVRLSNSDGTDVGEFTTEKSKFYFADGKCTLFLSDSEINEEDTGSKANGILKEANEYRQRTKNNTWNEF